MMLTNDAEGAKSVTLNTGQTRTSNAVKGLAGVILLIVVFLLAAQGYLHLRISISFFFLKNNKYDSDEKPPRAKSSAGKASPSNAHLCERIVDLV